MTHTFSFMISPLELTPFYREINGHFRHFSSSFRSFYMMRMTYPNHGINTHRYDDLYKSAGPLLSDLEDLYRFA